MNYKINKVDENFAEKIADIEKECFSNPLSFEKITTLIKNEHYFCIAVMANDDVIGYGSIKCLYENADIDRIAVKKAFRNKGYGRIILENLVRIAKENKSEKVILEVRKSNFNAIHLYTSFGFEEISERKGYYSNPKEDANILSLNLI